MNPAGPGAFCFGRLLIQLLNRHHYICRNDDTFLYIYEMEPHSQFFGGGQYLNHSKACLRVQI